MYMKPQPHMGWGQEAYDAECAALARAFQTAASRDDPIGGVIISDAQAAIATMTSDEPGPHITALRAKEPNIQIEIRWCPSQQGIEGNETADEWAKLAADEPDALGVERLSTTDPDGKVTKRYFPLARSLAKYREVSQSRRGRLQELDQKKNWPGLATGSTAPAAFRNPTPRWPRPGSASRPASTSCKRDTV